MNLLKTFLAKLKKSCFPKMGEWGFFIFFGFSARAMTGFSVGFARRSFCFVFSLIFYRKSFVRAFGFLLLIFLTCLLEYGIIEL